MNLKKLLLFVLPILLLVSCDYHKDAQPSARYLSQQSIARPLTEPVNHEFEAAVELPGKATNAIYDSVYKVPMTWAQAWHANGFGKDFIFILCLICSGVCIYFMYKASNNQRDSNSKAFLFWLAPIFTFLIIACSTVDWFHVYEREIKKVDYVNYMQTDGNLEKFWPTPAQKY